MRATLVQHSLAGIIVLLTAATLPAGTSDGVNPLDVANRFGAADPFFGAYRQEVPIEVPPYRSLTPSLALRYSSSGANGWLGMGFTLDGISKIERAQPGEGAPLYDATDVFLLDGEELVPSTLLGGTHCTRHQSWLRIARDDLNDRWIVQDKTGRKSTFTSVLKPGSATFRWSLASIEDLRGNRVTINYFADSGRDCYPDSLVYNGATVKFWWETRTDPIQFATGASALGVTSYRLKTIDVTLNGLRARAYRLVYGTSTTTARSQLLNVLQYGTDAVLDAFGSVVGGTTGPGLIFDWQAGAAGFASWYGSGLYLNSTSTWDRLGDFDGDGRTDVLAVKTASNDGNGEVWLNTCNGSAFTPTNCHGLYLKSDPKLDLVADFTGDGKSDVLALWSATNSSSSIAWLNASTGAAFTPTESTGMFLRSAPEWNHLGDFDGDGRTDVLAVATTGVGTSDLWVNYATDNGFTVVRYTGHTVNGQRATQTLPGDFNGDGKTDLLSIFAAGSSSSTAYVNYSTGNGFDSVYCTGLYLNATDDWNRIGDFNGDGKSDVVAVTATGNATSVVKVNWSTGNAFTWSSCSGLSLNSSALWNMLGDVNGDGRTDIAAVWSATSSGSSTAYVNYSTDGSFSPVYHTSLYVNSSAGWDRLGDFNGDGRDDLLAVWIANNSTSSSAWVNQGFGPMDLVDSIGNLVGGTTALQYTPSTAWSNDNLPQGFVTPTVVQETTSDGTFSSTVTHSYEGGAWLASERRFLGFRNVTSVLDAAGNRTESTNRQTPAGAGEPDDIWIKDPSGRVWAHTRYEYAEVNTPPYVSLLSARTDEEWNLTSSPRRIGEEFSYDGFGNLVAKSELGDLDVTGDERGMARGYPANLADYIVGLPGFENVYGSEGDTVTLKTQTLWRYDGHASEIHPPARGDLTVEQRVCLEDANRSSTTTFTYDGWGNVITATDPLGNVTTTVWDGTWHVFPVATTNALGHQSTKVWDAALGVVTSATDANGNTTTFTHDVLGRPARETHLADGSFLEYSYQSWGQSANQATKLTISDGSVDGLWSMNYFDGLGRIFKRIREGALTQAITYGDGSRRPRSQSTWSGRYESYAYDGIGRLITLTHPDNSRVQIVYKLGSVEITDELGHRKEIGTDAYGRTSWIIEWTGSTSATTTYAYDSLDHLQAVVDAAGNLSSCAWDSLGQKTGSWDPDAGHWSFEYDRRGQLVRQTDAAGDSVELAYDALGRITSKVWPGGRTAAEWTWDEPGHGKGIGRVTSVAYPEGGESYKYDFAGRQTRAARTVRTTTVTTHQSYDIAGRLASITYPDGEVVTYTYDGAGRLKSMPGYVTNFIFDKDEKPTQMANANGTTATLIYNDNRNWMLFSILDGPGGRYFQENYAWDVAGRVTARTSPVNPSSNRSYAYDDCDRLVTSSGAQTQAFTYDSLGNMAFNSAVGDYAYADPQHVHAVTRAGDDLLDYGSNGELIRTDRRSFRYDPDHRLVAVRQQFSGSGGPHGGGGLGAKDMTTRFGYDANGRRVLERGPSGTTLWFGPLAESRNGRLVKNYFAGSTLVARREGANVFWFHTDGLGSVRVVTDAAGQVVSNHDFGPFGEAIGAFAADSGGRGFGGHVEDPATGLVYMNARFYDPRLGRFLTPDPLVRSLEDPQSLNRYSYALNNPTSNIDPTGHLTREHALILHQMAMAGVPGWVVDMIRQKLKEQERRHRHHRPRQHFSRSPAEGAADLTNLAPSVAFEATAAIDRLLNPQLLDSVRWPREIWQRAGGSTLYGAFEAPAEDGGQGEVAGTARSDVDVPFAAAHGEFRYTERFMPGDDAGAAALDPGGPRSRDAWIAIVQRASQRQTQAGPAGGSGLQIRGALLAEPYGTAWPFVDAMRIGRGSNVPALNFDGTVGSCGASPGSPQGLAGSPGFAIAGGRFEPFDIGGR